jgi:cytochrome P450
MLQPTKVDFVSNAFKANPFPFYQQLRAEAPIYHTTLPDKRPAWLITRYDDVQAILKDDACFVKNKHLAMTATQAKQQPWMPGFLRAFERNMLDVDGADHARLRGLVHKAFTPRLVEQMRTRIEVIANDLIDIAIARGTGTMDLMDDFALPVPLTIIAEILGIPQPDRLKFHRWIKNMLSATSQSQLLWKLPTALRFIGYLRRMFKERRLNPTDDLLSALVQAEQEGDQLNEDELLAMAVILLIAGHETTVNLIGSGSLALLEHPDQMARLHADPAIIKPAIEELLRFTNPVEWATERYPMGDVTLHGITIPRGELVVAVLASANRDETQFANPDTLDLTRDPNRHLAFGQGVHYCVGSPLARMEGAIALNTLFARLPNLRLTMPATSLKWRGTAFLRGLDKLPVTF